MYVVEISLRLSPVPVTVQRKELADAQALYGEVRKALEGGEPRLLDLTCEKDPHKCLCLLSAEIQAIQLYEKSAVGGGGKRPGFSVDS